MAISKLDFCVTFNTYYYMVAYGKLSVRPSAPFKFLLSICAPDPNTQLGLLRKVLASPAAQIAFEQGSNIVLE
jgi:hypothetical protein